MSDSKLVENAALRYVASASTQAMANTPWFVGGSGSATTVIVFSEAHQFHRDLLFESALGMYSGIDPATPFSWNLRGTGAPNAPMPEPRDLVFAATEPDLYWLHARSQLGERGIAFLNDARTIPAMSFTSEPLHVTGSEVLGELMTIAPVPAERLAAILGASRRSVYNWVRGREPSPDYDVRIRRMRDALWPLAGEWQPTRIAQWLESGPGPPAALIQTQNWDNLIALVEQARRAVPEPASPSEEQEALQPEAYPLTVHTAALAAMRATPTLGPRRPDWQPRELTGATATDDE